MQDTHTVSVDTPAALDAASRRYLPWMMLLFFGSGCAALIYEVIWLQLLELVIGSSGVSLGVLLGTYMGGMCIGSLLLPRLISDKAHPLRVYAWLEIGIGLIGIMVLFGMPLVTDLYAVSRWHGIFIRAFVAAFCLVPPTLLMGATLPAVARFVKSSPEGVSWMGFFYGGNIVGAVCGCLVAGFFLLRLFDMPTGTYAAAGINLLVAAVAFLLARRTEYVPQSEDAEQITPRPRNNALVYVTIALSGLSALGAEVVWTRLLALLLGGTVYSFSIILAVFLVGLGLGSTGGALLSRTCRRPRLALVLCQAGLAAAIGWAAIIISRSLPYWPVNPGIYTSDLGPWFIFQLDLLRAAWAILPATFLWGASFPLAIASVASPGRDAGRLVGTIYAANTIGSILGSLAFSLWIIPSFGTLWAERTLVAVAVVSSLAALAAFAKRGSTQESLGLQHRLSFSGGVAIVAVLTIAALLAGTVSRFPWQVVAWGRFAATYMSQAEPGISEENQKSATSSQWRCTYVGEGMNVSVAVTRNASGSRFFHGAGKVQASSQPQDMRLQRMLGHLSALACKDPQKVEDILVVACGAGVTAGAFVVYPGVRRITVCDIEPLVPKVVTPMFGRENYHLMDGIQKQNPHIVNGKRVTAVFDDGRHYIRTLPADTKFDVITSDPIDPWVKGSAALNTVEYYEMCKKHLKPGGVMTLWMPLYESNMESSKSLIATFFKVFPDGMLFSNDQHLEGYDAVLLGQLQPSPVDLDRLNQLLSRSEYLPVKESLREVGFGSGFGYLDNTDMGVLVELLATFAVRGSDLRPWTRDAQINYDRNLRLQYLAGMYYNSYLSTTIFQNIISYYRFPENLFTGSQQNLQTLKQALSMSGRH